MSASMCFLACWKSWEDFSTVSRQRLISLVTVIDELMEFVTNAKSSFFKLFLLFSLYVKKTSTWDPKEAQSSMLHILIVIDISTLSNQCGETHHIFTYISDIPGPFGVIEFSDSLLLQ